MKENNNLKIFSSYFIGGKTKEINKFIIENLDLLESFCDVIIERLENSSSDYRNYPYIGIMDSINQSKEFLDTLSNEYKIDFDKKINDGTFVIYDSKDEESDEFKAKGTWVGVNRLEKLKNEIIEEDDYYIINTKNNNFRVNIPTFYRRIDSFDMVHEYFHTVVYPQGKLSFLFCEAIPISMEYAFMKYLEDKKIDINEFIENIELRTNSLLGEANSLKSKITFYKNNINDIIEDVDIDENMNNELGYEIQKEIQYLLGDLFGLCIYKDICSNKAKYKDLNKFINEILYSDNIDCSYEYKEEILSYFLNYLDKNKEEALNFISKKYFQNENVKLKK